MEYTEKKAGTLSDRAYQLIKADITSGRLRPGDVLGEAKLSQQISISRTPVRAALQRLVCEGLAQADQNKSVRVTNVTGSDIRQITQVREVLEPLVIRLLRDTLTPEGAARLRRLREQEKALAAQTPLDHLALIDIDYELHVTMAELTGNQFLLDTIRRIKTSSSRFLILSGTMDKYGVTGTQEHEEIIRFLENGQFDYAEVAARNHAARIGDRILT